MALTTQVLPVGFNTASLGNLSLVSAPAANQSFFIRGLGFVVNGATTITINSQLTGLSFGPFVFPAAGGILVLPDLMPTEEADAFYTAIAAGTALVINNSAAVQISGYVRYSVA